MKVFAIKYKLPAKIEKGRKGKGNIARKEEIDRYIERKKERERKKDTHTEREREGDL